VRGVSEYLFKDRFVVPFEITGVILLAAMVAVVVLARRDLRAPSLAEFARERAFDPRPLVTNMPEPAAPDGIERIMILRKGGSRRGEGAVSFFGAPVFVLASTLFALGIFGVFSLAATRS